jgi:tRNA(Ile)-lysidine synthase
MKLVPFRTVPKECYLAFSGGIDSSALLRLLIFKKIQVTLLVIDHLTEFGKLGISFAKEMAKLYNIDVVVKKVKAYDESTSLEAFWSRERNSIFQSMDKPVLTAHHLNDVTEWYFMTCCQGNGRLMSYQNNNVLRPLITTPKEKIRLYAKEHDLKYIDDPSNKDSNFCLRNKVRNVMLPFVADTFPGLQNTVRRLIVKKETIKT